MNSKSYRNTENISINTSNRSGLLILSTVLILLSSPFAFAQKGQSVTDEWLERNYSKREVLVQVRDGARIYASVFEPVSEFMGSIGRSSSPVLLTMTPYSLKPYGLKKGETFTEKSHSGYLSSLKSDMANYVADGYIVVYLNARGKYLSEGDYANMRPYISDTDGAVDTVIVNGKVQTDDATDIYDVVEWVLNNTDNNGNVGVKGVSYPGFYTTMAILSRHPAIKAASPQAPATDWFMGDDAHRNGAFCIADMYRFGSGFFRTRKQPSPKGLSSLFSTKEDIYEYFCGKPFSELSAFFGDSLSFWNDMMAHPDYDSFWQARNPSAHLRNISIPVLVTGGFYDAEDCYGAFKTYDMLKKNSPECELYLAAGPWYHGGWNNRAANHIGDAWFGNASGAYYQDKIEYPFFAYYLDNESFDLQGIADYVEYGTCSGSQTTTNGRAVIAPRLESDTHSELQTNPEIKKPASVNVLASRETSRKAMENVESDSLWETYDEWPPKDTHYRKLYLSGKDSLRLESHISGKKSLNSESNPALKEKSLKSKTDKPEKFTRTFVSDSSSPVPYMDVKANSRDRAYMTADQRFASQRNDVLTYRCRTVKESCHLAGPVKVHLVLTLNNYPKAQESGRTTDERGTDNGVGINVAHSSELDADIVVKLIDVRPDGYQMLVRGDVMPLRFRDGFASAKPTKAGRDVEVDFTMCDVDHIIVPGHSLMVQIQGSWFPLIVMNPQTFLANPYTAESDDYRPIEISIHSGKSYLEIPLL